MQQIKLNIEEQYLTSFLQYLTHLKYVEIESIVKRKAKKKIALPTITANDMFLQTAEIGDPLRQAVKPTRSHVTLDEMMEEQGYQGTNWERLDKLVQEMDIQEPIEELLAQLTK